MSENEFEPIEPTQSELLKYHLSLTNKVDFEMERRKAINVLSKLDTPEVFVQHKNAEISHASQQVPVNENNLQLEKKAKAAAKVVVKEDKKESKTEEFRHLSFAESVASNKEMEAQVKNAANRTPKPEPWVPVVDPDAPVVVVPVVENKPVIAPWA